jgi:hypothetical protein
MRIALISRTIGVMRIFRSKKQRKAAGAVGVELAGALSAASQMALFCPPGFDEVIRRELLNEAAPAHDRERSARPHGK